MRSMIIAPSEVTEGEPVAMFSAPLAPINIDSADSNMHAMHSAKIDTIDGFASSETFSNYTEKTVEFAPITRIWYIGDADFRTQCTLTPDIEVNPNDWIGIYDANFHSLDDYIAYEYLAKVSLPETPTASGQPRTITLSFPVGSISEPFEVSSKEDSLVVIDPCEQASSSSSPGRPKPSTATSDIFTDFTGLDVAKLSRHFSNDLSID
ncbi:hypothetical protein HF086_004995 [Spodoptera exigua]|uniref:SKICH domain-containing protein n=1 Tax=Spodoptera exigua TaxID=7107 RepID=A0A922S915_SPOEX|nr:hypothetical protein HF086_004995 [Spodoptera exigua]